MSTSPRFDFSGKRVLITGGTSGMGESSALSFAGAGARVVVETGGHLYRDAWEQKPPLLLGVLTGLRALSAERFNLLSHVLALGCVAAVVALIVAGAPGALCAKAMLGKGAD